MNKEQSEQQQEPFAYYFETYSYEGQKSTWFVACPCDGKLNGKPGIPLYTSPPAQQEPVATLFGSLPVYDTSLPAQRTWVGLTDEERDAIIGATDLSGTYYYDDLYAVILLAEGKLKEKNA